MLTADEMHADAERFFAILDSNHDGQIDPEELDVYELEIAPEIQVNSRWKRSPQAAAEAKPGKDHDRGDRKRRRADDYVDGYQLHGLQGAARYGLLNIPQPVASADADFNRGITLDEFRRAATHRFKLLDSKRDGRLTLPELEARLPTRPTASGYVKRSQGCSRYASWPSAPQGRLTPLPIVEAARHLHGQRAQLLASG